MVTVHEGGALISPEGPEGSVSFRLGSWYVQKGKKSNGYIGPIIILTNQGEPARKKEFLFWWALLSKIEQPWSPGEFPMILDRGREDLGPIGVEIVLYDVWASPENEQLQHSRPFLGHSWKTAVKRNILPVGRIPSRAPGCSFFLEGEMWWPVYTNSWAVAGWPGTLKEHEI